MHVARVKLIDKTPFIRQVKHKHVVVSNGRVCPWPQQLPVQGPETDEQPWYIISFRHNLSVVSPQRREFFYVGGDSITVILTGVFCLGKTMSEGLRRSYRRNLFDKDYVRSVGGILLRGASLGCFVRGIVPGRFSCGFRRPGWHTYGDRPAADDDVKSSRQSQSFSVDAANFSNLCTAATPWTGRRDVARCSPGTWAPADKATTDFRRRRDVIVGRWPTSGDDVTSSSVGGDTRRRSREPGETRQMLRVTRLFICTCDKLLTFLVWKL